LQSVEWRDALGCRRCAAEVVGEPLARCGLSKQGGKSELTDAARACEQQGVGETIAAERAAERCDDAFVAEKFRKAHASAYLTSRGRGKEAFNGGKDIHGDFFRFANGLCRSVETLNGGPRNTARERVVHLSGVLEMMKAGLKQILAGAGVATGRLAVDQALRLVGRHAKIT